MGDRLRLGKSPWYFTKPPIDQLNLLSYEGQQLSTAQCVVMLCGWEVKAGMAHSTCG